ncbi:MAG: apolipoprotein N-acyltransferase [Actinomycetota bacterium]
MRLTSPEVRSRRSYVVALATGGLLSFAFPETDLWFLAWIALAPLLAVLQGAGWARGARLGFLFGVGYFGLLLHWVSIIGYLGYFVLILLQAGFSAVFGALWGRCSSRGRGVAYRLLAPAALWVAIVEFLRANFPLRGFPWGQLAQSQGGVGWVIPSAGIGGSWLTAFILVIANGAVVMVVDRDTRRDGLRVGSILVAGLLAIALWPGPKTSEESLKVAIVQGNIPRDMEPSYLKDRIIIANHVRATEALSDDVDLVVWPESSVGIDPALDPEVGEIVADAARAVGAPMVVGGNMENGDGRYRVMAYLYSADGEIVDRYQKTHLVPFGEYVPARDLLDFIPALEQVPRDAVPGDRITLFDVDGVQIATAISFEGDFGSLVRDRIAAGGRILIVDTNTSTWGESWASAQHLAMSQVRAAENGVPVVHAALTGVSGFIEPNGEVVQRSDLWETRTLVRDVAPAASVTLYARWGDYFAWLCVAGSVVVCATRPRRPVTVLA